MIYTERYVHYVPVYDLYTEYHSADQVFAFVSAALQSFPDFTVTMKSSRFTLRQDGLSYILAKVHSYTQAVNDRSCSRPDSLCQ